MTAELFGASASFGAGSFWGGSGSGLIQAVRFRLLARNLFVISLKSSTRAGLHTLVAVPCHDLFLHKFCVYFVDKSTSRAPAETICYWGATPRFCRSGEELTARGARRKEARLHPFCTPFPLSVRIVFKVPVMDGV